MSKKSAKQLVMTPLYRQRVVKAKKGRGSYCRKQKPRTEFRGFFFVVVLLGAPASSPAPPAFGRRSQFVGWAWPTIHTQSVKVGRAHPTGLQILPLLLTNLGLTQNPGQQVSPDIPLMRIRYRYGYISFSHKLVSSTSVRTIKSQLSEIADQIPPLDWTEPWHGLCHFFYR